MVLNWKRSFLIIQLSLKFGFGHQTPKPVIFGHPTIKTVQIWPLDCFLWVVLIVFIYNLVLRTSNDYYFFLVPLIMVIVAVTRP
jgi:hypothetical protein